MEGMYWFRLSAIGALILGSVYVLLPTLLGEASEDQLVDAASSVETSGPRAGVDLGIELRVTEGEPEALIQSLRARLEAAKLPISILRAGGEGIELTISVGGDPSEAERLVSIPGEVSVYDPAVITDLPDPGAPPEGGATPPQPVIDALSGAADLDLAYWAAVLGSLAGEPVPDGAQAGWLVSSATTTEAGTVLTLEALEGAPADPPAVRVLSLDGRIAGVVMADGRLLSLDEGPAAADLGPVVSAGALPGAVEIVEEIVQPRATQAAAAPKDRDAVKIPPWLAGLLPNTRIPLGLDLQGGIDLTLQVELDEAVLGQATRDTTYLKDAAAKEGLIVESVRRAPDAPILEITTQAELSEVTRFVAERLGDYQYFESDGTMHRFEMTEVRQEEVQNQAVEQVLETLRKRIDALGTKEPSIVKKGGGRINVQLPGMVDVQAATTAIGTTAVLEFRMVDHDFDDALLEQILNTAQAEMPQDQFFDDDLLNRWLWDTKRLDPDRIILWSEPGNEKMLAYASNAWPRMVTEEGAVVEAAPMPLFNNVPLTGNDVNDAGVGFDQNNLPGVSLEFKPRGGQIFCELTKQAVGKQFAIILDETIQSAPRINEQICGGAARIDMSSSADPLKEAQTLALVLRTGALDAPLVIASVRHVGASLGADSIRQGSIGALVGSLIVLVFMAAWYRTAGLIADFALMVNVLLVLACLAMFGATLTLPGIAGIALTVGMAVDANIIIYERIREELRLGVQARKAVDVGFDKAIVAVLDANITTAIAGVVLFSYGTGPIKGFAVTLLIGIATTLVSALFVTRTVMELITRSSSARLRI